MAPEAPARNPDEMILCIQDLKESAVKKLPHGIKGRAGLPHCNYRTIPTRWRMLSISTASRLEHVS